MLFRYGWDIEFTPKGTILLYPYDVMSYLTIVPNEMMENTAVWDRLISSPLFSVWASSIAVFSAMRIVVRTKSTNWKFRKLHTSENDLLYIFFDTFGLSFGTTSAHGVHALSEQIIVTFLSLFCILASIFCSGFLFEQMTTSTYIPKIKTFEDVLNSSLDLYIDNELRLPFDIDDLLPETRVYIKLINHINMNIIKRSKFFV